MASNSTAILDGDLRPSCIGRLVTAAGLMAALCACQSPESDFKGEHFSNETRALEKQLDAEAAALGTAQAAMSIPAAFDPTGIASLTMMPAGRAARNAWMRSADARMKTQLDKDEQEIYRRYGMTPDGRPSGRKPL